jgi:hypothetical protein
MTYRYGFFMEDRLRFLTVLFFPPRARASVAQLVELLICNQSAGGSSPSAGSITNLASRKFYNLLNL